MLEYPDYAPCPAINHVVVQLHNRPDVLYSVALQEKPELLLCHRLAHVLSCRDTELSAQLVHSASLLSEYSSDKLQEMSIIS